MIAIRSGTCWIGGEGPGGKGGKRRETGGVGLGTRRVLVVTGPTWRSTLCKLKVIQLNVWSAISL